MLKLYTSNVFNNNMIWSRNMKCTFRYGKGRTKSSNTTVPITDTWNYVKDANVSSEMEGKTPVTVDITDPAYSLIDLSFNNTEEAFKSKTNFELLRSLIVFKLCSIPFFVNKNKEVCCNRTDTT